MATLTIRNLDEGLKARLRLRAARHERSMEEEARSILRAALTAGGSDEVEPNLAEAARTLFGPLGGLDLPEIPREPLRER